MEETPNLDATSENLKARLLAGKPTKDDVKQIYSLVEKIEISVKDLNKLSEEILQRIPS